MNTNRYSGFCETCHAGVAARAGVWDWGLYCSEREFFEDPVTGVVGWYCAPKAAALRAQVNSPEVQAVLAERRAAAAAEIAKVRASLETFAAEVRVRSLAAVIAKVCEREATVTDLTNEEVQRVYSELCRRRDARKRRAERATMVKNDTCTRCFGHGGFDKWANTGWTCFKCGGSGKHYN